MVVLSKLPDAPKKAVEWIQNEEGMFRYCGFMTLTHLFRRGIKLDKELENTYLATAKNIEELEELITKWAALEDTNPALKVEKSPAEPKEGSKDAPGFFYYYSQWVQETGLYVPKEE
jgi:hypothetical protein